MGNRGKVVDNSEYLDRYKLVGEEKAKLLKQFSALPTKQKNIVDGLIERAAFMRIMLAGLEEDIKKNGEFELFTQSDAVQPYQRKRPAVDIYNASIKNYSSIIKQLAEMLPAENENAEDELMAFLPKKG